jgi:hypothetical protein
VAAQLRAPPGLSLWRGARRSTRAAGPGPPIRTGESTAPPRAHTPGSDRARGAGVAARPTLACPRLIANHSAMGFPEALSARSPAQPNPRPPMRPTPCRPAPRRRARAPQRPAQPYGSDPIADSSDPRQTTSDTVPRPGPCRAKQHNAQTAPGNEPAATRGPAHANRLNRTHAHTPAQPNPRSTSRPTPCRARKPGSQPRAATNLRRARPVPDPAADGASTLRPAVGASRGLRAGRVPANLGRRLLLGPVPATRP